MKSITRTRALAGAAVLLIAAFAVWMLFFRGGDGRPEALQAAFARTSAADLARANPLAWAPGQDAELALRARDGLAHPLWAGSRGGVERSSAVIARLEPFFRRAARAAGVDPSTLAALVYVKSGGRADLTVDPESAEGPAGLAGLSPEVALEAGLQLDLKRSNELTAGIARLTAKQAKAKKKSDAAKFDPVLVEMRAERRKADERFEITKALPAAARYLHQAEKALGREDLALLAYRIGLDEVRRLLSRYGTKRMEIPYTRLYFDTDPTHNPDAFEILSKAGTDADFPFVVEGARQILDFYDTRPDHLYALANLHGAKPGAEDVLWPPASTETFPSHNALADAYGSGRLVALPDDPGRLGFEQSPEAGRVFRNELHRGLRPAALATLIYVAGLAREYSGNDLLTLQLAGAVKPETGKQRLDAAGRNVATGSLAIGSAFGVPTTYERPPNSTGYSFKLKRSLGGDDQAAVDTALARLRALNVIEVVRDGKVDRVTVGPRGAAILAAMR